MLDLDANPRLRLLHRVARTRVTLGFVVAAAAFWLATPSWTSLGWGGLVATLGELVRVWAAGHLRKSQEVTTSGPYRLTRHPLYVGSFGLGVGFAIASASVPAAGLVLGYLSIMLWVAVRLEEATLRASFGTDYDRYAEGTLTTRDRAFSLTQAMRNGEHRAVLGLAGALGLLALKAL